MQPRRVFAQQARRSVTLVGAIAILLTASPVWAQSGEMVALDLPAQELSDSLLQLGRAAQLEIGFSSDVLAGIRASALRGVYDPHEAVRLLLAGTGLTVDIIAPGVLIV